MNPYWYHSIDYVPVPLSLEKSSGRQTKEGREGKDMLNRSRTPASLRGTDETVVVTEGGPITEAVNPSIDPDAEWKSN